MFEKLAPRPYKNWIQEQITYSGSKRSVKGFINSTVFLSLMIGIIAGFVTGVYSGSTTQNNVSVNIMFNGPIGLGVGVCIFVLLNGFLMLSVDRRSKFVERILPDALQLMAANSRAGYIPSRALLLSARPEFGPLSDAIKEVGKEIVTGKPFDESLMKVTKYIKSDLVDRTMKLIVEGTKAGGQFATLLEENAEDLRRIDIIKKEVQSNIMVYIIFVGFAGVLGAPALYALSTFLIGTITQLGAAVSVPDIASQSTFLRFGTIDISKDFLFYFSLISILITTSFGSMIIGLISSGSSKAGIKYLPIFVVGGLAVFFIAQIAIGAIFGIISPGGVPF